MAASAGATYFDDVIIRNLQAAMFKRSTHKLGDKVVSMAAVDNYVVIGTARRGCHVFNIREDEVIPVCTLGDASSKTASSSKSGGATGRPGAKRSPPGGGGAGGAGRKRSPPDGGTTAAAHNVCVSTKHIVYMKETGSGCSVCVHRFSDVLAGRLKPAATLPLQRRAPMVLEPQLGLLVIGSVGWKTSWTSESSNSGDSSNSGGSSRKRDAEDVEGDERNVKVLTLETLSVTRELQVAENCVAILRLQRTEQHSMLGIADSRSGLSVLDLRQPTQDGGYHVLYHVPVEEIRNFELVGDFVGVFHRFEPNVTFWNMMEQKTILCINIQDQVRQLAEEFYEDDEDDGELFDDENDHVTAVTCVPHDQSDFMLIYGIKSGCIFGMSVENRTKVFSVPYPHEIYDDTNRVKTDVLGLCFLPKGKMLICYEEFGLTMLDFAPEAPPDRPPPTRCQHRETEAPPRE